MLRSNVYFFWFFVLLLALLSAELKAQTPTPLNTKHQFDKEKLDALRKEVDYQYDEVSAEPSTWQKIKQVIREWFRNLTDTEQKQTVWSWVLTVFSGLVLLLVVLRLAGIDKHFLFTKKVKEGKEPSFFEQFEQLDEIDLEQKIKEAIQLQDYALAIRWFYLKSLKILQSKRWIQWQKDKTNQTYLSELNQNKPLLSKDFQLLTHWFEYVYYGDFEIKSTDFEEVKVNFEDFEQKIRITK